MKTILQFALALTLGSTAVHAADKSASINLDANTRYQHVSGFGGFSPSPQWSYWLNDSQMDLLFGQGENQLGYNIVRLYIANNKNYWGSGVANAKRAQKHGAFIFASPWSPPASWKDNNSDSNGGALLESRYGDWATFLNDYYLYMKQQGVTIDAVSVQNEPDWTASYQSCIWTGQQLAKFLREQGSKIQCKVIAPESIHFTKSLHEPILNDEQACANLDILGGHFYGWDGSSYPLAAQKGKEVWMTEFLINDRQEQQGVETIDWKTDGFLFANNVNAAMLANFSAWVHYSLKRYYGCIGDGTHGTVDNQVTKRGYILSQYAKYVSGTTRIRHGLTDATGKLSSSAYMSVTGDSVVVMVINPSENTYATTLTLPFYTKKGLHVVTSEDKNVAKDTLKMEAESYQPVVSVTPWSVNTYIFTKTADRTDIPVIHDETQILYSDQFDLAGGGCVPAGWRCKSESGIRTAGNFDLGPRIMNFSAEGLMQYAFYFRTNETEAGYISYGEEANYRLTLKPGKYALSYSTVGWKATPTLSAKVLNPDGTTLKSQVCTPTSQVSTNGASARITKTTDKTLEFEVTQEADYQLRWVIAKSSGGLTEALVGNIKLILVEDTSAISTLANEPADTDATTFDLMGRPVLNPQPNTLYIKKGQKVIVR